ncbi:hypothetical protein [Bordetella hinzii]|uniref:hypothetical protein n=1 Tax=Bordetella hinzii TaxID=103855 RepID=UPI0012393EF6|nr:hypothetical protein [Bordetella hinzii]MBZ0073602.1 hypothetical protein [Bordetella hinzii]MBZ0077922.1 hypothetical protein [Bordetella hinzii]MBZ0082399.1 hypothetical protein [Bordetella hinzii]QET42213.1 hypothetical protein FOB29_00600 [Bordetella hinzii]QWF39248.1 hypothetical protein HHA25_13620 [Bordetella hinzii]
MNNAQFLTVADAVRSSAEAFEAAVLSGLRQGVEKMSPEQMKEAFFPELVGADVDRIPQRLAA